MGATDRYDSGDYAVAQRWPLPIFEMACMLLRLSIWLLVLLYAGPVLNPQPKNVASTQSLTKERLLKLTLTTGGGRFGPSQTSYRRGVGIPVIIWMTNTSENGVTVCDNHTLFQDRPILMKNGRKMTYRKELLDFIAKHSEGECEVIRSPRLVELPPHIPTRVGWFFLVEGQHKTGNVEWYETLDPGQYQLSLMRSIECCDGERLKAEAISFEVTP